MFHVSIENHANGTLLNPGMWGRRLNGMAIPPGSFSDTRTLAWEMALEAARRAIDDTLPSRLASVFLAPSLDDARSFRDRFKVGGSIFNVDLPVPDLRRHVGRFDLLDAGDEPWFQAMPHRARDYWTSAPQGIVEVLYPGPVIIRDQVD